MNPRPGSEVDVDLLAGVVTVTRSKNGHARRVPINSAVAGVLVDLGAARGPDAPADACVFGGVPYRTACRAFADAVGCARAALRAAGADAGRLDGYTWHGNRHTFASRLVMAGVDPITVQDLGGWRTAAMVARYAHLAPDHRARAVERLVAVGAELSRNFPGPVAAPHAAADPVA